MELDFESQIQVIALGEVMATTDAWFKRHVYRWYSARFATPLHLVPALNYADVLLAFYEERYEGMDDEERREHRLLLTETDTQRKAREAILQAEASADAFFEKFAEAEAKRLETTPVPVQKAVRPIPHPHKQAPEAELPIPQHLPPDVKIKFVDSGFFDELIDKLDQE